MIVNGKKKLIWRSIIFLAFFMDLLNCLSIWKTIILFEHISGDASIQKEGLGKKQRYSTSMWFGMKWPFYNLRNIL